MNVEIKIEEGLKDIRVVILSPAMDERVNRLLSRLSEEEPRAISGFADGSLSIVDPQDIIRAFLIQCILPMIYGGMFSAASVIWDMEDWNLAKQTFIRLLIVSTVSFPVTWYLRWMRHSLVGVVSCYAVFLAVYFLIWTVAYLVIRRNIKYINSRLNG